MGRGCLPPDHELFFSRARGAGLGGCDVALVVGVPLDFRLGFGQAIAADAKLITLDFGPNRLERNRTPDVGLVGDIGATLSSDPRGERRRSRPHRQVGGRAARHRERQAGPRRPTSSAMTARPCTRCGSTGSSASSSIRMRS